MGSSSSCQRSRGGGGEGGVPSYIVEIMIINKFVMQFSQSTSCTIEIEARQLHSVWPPLDPLIRKQFCWMKESTTLHYTTHYTTPCYYVADYSKPSVRARGHWTKLAQKWRGLRRGVARANKAEPNTDEGGLASLSLSPCIPACLAVTRLIAAADWWTTIRRQKVHVSSLTEPHKLYYIFYIKKCVCASTLPLIFCKSCCRLLASLLHLCLLFRLRPECIKLSFRLARVLTFALT